MIWEVMVTELKHNRKLFLFLKKYDNLKAAGIISEITGLARSKSAVLPTAQNFF
jgi:hypothetical protein